MAEQNFAEIGLDVSSFTPEKSAKLNEFLILFEKLEKYSALTINPVMGPGLVEFNNALTATSTLLTELNTKLQELNKNTAAIGNTTKSNARSTKELTKEQADLKVKIQEANKALLDQAKANNASVQSREAQKKSIADQKKAEADLAAQKKKDAVEQNRLDKQAAADQKALEAERARIAKQRVADEKAVQSAKLASIQAEKEESAAVNKLTSDYELLKLAQRDQAERFANLYINKGGKKAGATPESDAALADFKETSTVINSIEDKLAKASGTAQLFGGALSGAFSQIRTLAYILPGLGIAGIFNLAFEAIGKAVEELGLFTNQTEKYLKYQIAVNKALAETIALNEELFSLDKKLSEDLNGRTSAVQAAQINQSRGVDNVRLANERKNLSEQNLLKSTADLIARGLSPESLKSDLENRLRVMNSYAKQIDDIQKKIDKAGETPAKARGVDENGRQRDIQGSRIGLPSIDKLKLQKELYEAKLKVEEDRFKIDKEFQDKYLAEQQEFFEADAALLKTNEDEKRSIKINARKEDAELDKELRESILDKEISTEKERAAAFRKIRDDQKSLNATNLYNVIGNDKLGIPRDLSATPSDIANARKTRNAEDIRAERELAAALFELHESYRQRRLTAQLAIDKNEIEESAITNEKLFRNEDKNLNDRLESYINYIKEKQRIQDLEFKRDIDVQALKGDDPTAKKEIERLNSDRLTQQKNIQADVEKQVYDIIFTSTQKRLRFLKEANDVASSENTRIYAEELMELNKSFDDKLISYKKYKEKRKQIDFIYGRSALDADIKDAELALKKLQEEFVKLVDLREKSRTESEIAKDNLNFSKNAGIGVLEAKRQADTKAGQFEGYNKAVDHMELALDDAQERLEAARLKRAKAGPPAPDEKDRRRALQAIRQIENEIYQTIKELGDREYLYKLEQVQKEKALVAEQYGSEIAAIQKSSLYTKDKIALDIQLNAQKRQKDKELAREERKIKHDMAVFDRDISIAHIILNTAEAVAALLEFPPLAIAAGVTGAAALVKATNVRIPAYEKGSQGLQEGHVARYGESGPERIEKPYQSPYLVMQETVGYLPKGTKITPLKDSPEFHEKVEHDNWDQTRWLAKQFKKAMPDTKVINNIHIDLGFEQYKRQIIGN